jgi:hypothetical protein
MVKKNDPYNVTLSIGDGANDVSMIQVHFLRLTFSGVTEMGKTFLACGDEGEV